MRQKRGRKPRSQGTRTGAYKDVAGLVAGAGIALCGMWAGIRTARESHVTGGNGARASGNAESVDVGKIVADAAVKVGEAVGEQGRLMLSAAMEAIAPKPPQESTSGDLTERPIQEALGDPHDPRWLAADDGRDWTERYEGLGIREPHGVATIAPGERLLPWLEREDPPINGVGRTGPLPAPDMSGEEADV